MQDVPRSLLDCGWNERPLSEVEFYKLCSLENIVVVTALTGWAGQYLHYDGRAVIVISPKLAGLTLLWVMFHELAHHYWHAPGCQFIRGEEATELEADLIATCALIPKKWLLEPGLWDLFEQGYPPELIETRKRVYGRYRL